MDEEIKILAMDIVKKTERKIRTVIKNEPFKLAKTVDIGADGTPTKYIDKVAEDVAVRLIKKSGLAVNLLSEEIGFVDNGGDFLFVLDPVDGTRNATRSIPFFSVSLAVGTTNLSDMEYGIVKNISNKDEFIAEKNHGAFLNKKKVIVPNMPAVDRLYDITFSKRHDSLTLSLASSNAVRSLGCASLEMCMVATGAIDAYVVGKDYMRVTDIAASTLFVREAGGIVADLFGGKLEMPFNLDARTGIIAAGNQQVIESIAEMSKIR